MKIKVCGLRERENIRAVAGLGPDLMGFIFYPASPRYAGDLLRAEDLQGLPSTTLKTGVFVNAGLSDIESIFRKYDLDFVQLHGDESPSYCEQLSGLGIPLIKAFRLTGSFDFDLTARYHAFCRYFLFDAPTVKYGGSGRRFDWELLDRYTLGHPFFLSGGIGPEDAEEILSLRHPALAGVDVNSRFEQSPGVKDTRKLEDFINTINKRC